MIFYFFNLYYTQCHRYGPRLASLKSRVEELEKLLEEERLKTTKERAEAEASLRAASDRIRIEAAENLRRYEEAAVRQQEQQNDIILALQVP